MVTEAVNDHLRLLASARPLDIESGGIHQVKPWFEGRLDFAPVVSFQGDADFPLRGGAVGYYLDRKAAVFVFTPAPPDDTPGVPRRRAPVGPSRARPIGRVQAQVATSRGFNAIMWREGELGYALVSDTDLPDLVKLVGRLAPTS